MGDGDKQLINNGQDIMVVEAGIDVDSVTRNLPKDNLER